MTIFNTVSKWSLVYTLGAFATYFRRITSENISLNLSMHLKESYFKELLRKKITTFGEQQTGSLTQQLNRDINEISSIVSTEFSSIIRGLAFFLFSVFFLLYNSLELTLFILFFMGILALFGIFFGRSLKKKKSKLGLLNRKLNSFTQEKFMQIKTVKLFTGESLELKDYNEQEKEIMKKTLVIGEFTSRFYAVMEFIGENALIWSIGYGVYLSHTNSYLTIGRLTAFGTYAVYTSIGFQLILGGYTEVIKAGGLYISILKVLNEEDDREEILSSPSIIKKHKNGASVSIQAISYSYPDRDILVLQDISMNIKSGEIWGIIGQSGSGKSTIFHLLTKLYSPVTGKIFINEIDINTQPAWWSRQLISIVSQEALLFSVSILDNIKYSNPNASEFEVEEACRRADAIEFINNLPEKFNTQVGENGFNLSGGQRQRIAIARALLKEPEILLLDEATSGLDGNSEALIQDIIEREVKKRGFTVIIITHRVNTLKDLADYVAVIKEGKIITAGTFNEISKSTEYQLLSRN